MVNFSYTLLQIAALVQRWSVDRISAEELRTILSAHESSQLSAIRKWIGAMTVPPLHYHSGLAHTWGYAIKELSLHVAGHFLNRVPDEFSPPGLIVSADMTNQLEFESTDPNQRLDFHKLGHSTALRWYKAALEPTSGSTFALFIPADAHSALAVWNHETRLYHLYCSR